ncbi:MAG TPA: hypothetical protein VEI97_19420, partial [bacterium]|nr:hypothetical protein [bacterium]
MGALLSLDFKANLCILLTMLGYWKLVEWAPRGSDLWIHAGCLVLVSTLLSIQSTSYRGSEWGGLGSRQRRLGKRQRG